MFEIIFLSAAGVYFITLVFLSLGLSKDFPKQKDYSPFVSVIVAARNEAENINVCLESLYKQDYPKDKYQVIIAEDYSTDETGNIIDSFIKDKSNFRKVIPAGDSVLTGKINALNSAVKDSDGELLLFTDADCIVPPGWISNMVSYYTENTGMVNSFSMTGSDNILSGVQSIDLLFLLSVAAGMANNGYPVSCIGNNMSVKKETYTKTGGYQSLPASVTEDYALLRGVNSLGDKKIIFPLDEKLLVITKPAESLADMLRQKKRWASGGLSSPNVSIFLMIISYLVNLLLVLSFMFYSPQVLYIILFKIFSEYLFLYQVHKKLNKKLSSKYFLLFEVYYILYTLVLPVILLFSRKVIWKGRTY